MLRIFLLLLSLFCIFSCTDKKSQNIVIGFDSNYIRTIEGKISRKIMTDYLIKNGTDKYEFKTYKHDDLIKNLNNGKLDIALDDFDKNKIAGRYFYSDNIFCDAVYFVMKEEKSRIFKYPDSLKIMSSGTIYRSNEYDMLIDIKSDRKKYYMDFQNLLKDFKEEKIDIAIVNRKDFYDNIMILPDTYLFFIETGKSYGKILFSKKTHNDSFRKYLENRKIRKHDWSDILGKISASPLL